VGVTSFRWVLQAPDGCSKPPGGCNKPLVGVTVPRWVLQVPPVGITLLINVVFVIARKLGLSAPEREYRFDPERRWRFDYAWPSLKVAVEIEGGIWIRGRHVRPTGYLADLEKYNRAVVLGWRVLRYAPHQLGRLEHDLRTLLDIGE